MNEEKTCVKVDFWIIGEDFNVEEVTQRLGIKPTETRQKSDFKIPMFAKVEWSISIDYEESNDITIQLRKLIMLLKGKQDIIRSILNENKLECGFCIVIQIYNDDSIIIEIPRDFIQFASEINAEIDFDIYNY